MGLDALHVVHLRLPCGEVGEIEVAVVFRTVDAAGRERHEAAGRRAVLVVVEHAVLIALDFRQDMRLQLGRERPVTAEVLLVEIRAVEVLPLDVLVVRVHLVERRAGVRVCGEVSVEERSGFLQDVDPAHRLALGGKLRALALGRVHVGYRRDVGEVVVRAQRLGGELGGRRVDGQAVAADAVRLDVRLVLTADAVVNQFRVGLEQTLLQRELALIERVVEQLAQVDDVGGVVREQVEQLVQVVDAVDAGAELIGFQNLIAEHTEQSLQPDLGLLLVQAGDIEMAARVEHVLADAPARVAVIGRLIVLQVGHGQTRRHALLESVIKQRVVEHTHLLGRRRDERANVLAHGEDVVEELREHGRIVIERVVAEHEGVLVLIVVGVRIAYDAERLVVAAAALRVVDHVGVGETEGLGQLAAAGFRREVEDANGAVEVLILLQDAVPQHLGEPALQRLSIERCVVYQVVTVHAVFLWVEITYGEYVRE